MMKDRLFLSLMDPGLYVFDPTNAGNTPEEILIACDRAYAPQIDTIRARAIVATLFGGRLITPESWCVCSLPVLTVLAEAWRARKIVWEQTLPNDRAPAPISPFSIGYFHGGGSARAWEGANMEVPAESFLEMLLRRMEPNASPLEGMQHFNERDDADGSDRRRLLHEHVSEHLSVRAPVKLRDVPLDEDRLRPLVEALLPESSYADGILALSEMSVKDPVGSRVYLRDGRGQINSALPQFLMKISGAVKEGQVAEKVGTAINDLLAELTRDQTPMSNFGRVRTFLNRYDQDTAETLICLARLVVNRTMADQTGARLREQCIARLIGGDPSLDAISYGQRVLTSRWEGPLSATGEVFGVHSKVETKVDWHELWCEVWRLVLDKDYAERFRKLRTSIAEVGLEKIMHEELWAEVVETIQKHISRVQLSLNDGRLNVQIKRRYERLKDQTTLSLAVGGFAFGQLTSLGDVSEMGQLTVSVGVAALGCLIGRYDNDIASSLLRRDLSREVNSELAALRTI